MNEHPSLTLSGAEANDALSHLGVRVSPATANLALLAALIAAYPRVVPWESASRIARKSQTGEAVRPRMAGEFWIQARQQGTGGTCFESNGAFFALLRVLGYDAYLTINNMGAECSVHTAIIVQFPEGPVLVDVGMPLDAPLPLDATRATVTESPFHTYTVTPVNNAHYEISRDRHPRAYCFTLIDRPVSEADCWAAATADYGVDGLFLDRVIVMKVVGDRILRFDGSSHDESVIKAFADGRQEVFPLYTDHVRILAGEFAIDADVLRSALIAVGYHRFWNIE